MILISNDYRIRNDLYCFILEKKGTTKDGGEKWVNIGFFNTIEQCLKVGIWKDVQHKAMEIDGGQTLNDALDKIDLLIEKLNFKAEKAAEASERTIYTRAD